MEEAFKINQKSSKHRNDNAVQGTNDSSILSKISCSEMNYFDDRYLKHFATKIVRRSPLVNRGYYIRAKLIDFIIKEFLSKVSNDKNPTNQIVNLGAGFDSTFFRLKNWNLLSKTLFIEIDFPDVISRKVNLIKSNENLLNFCPDLNKIKDINGNTVFRSETSNYVLIGMDIRNTKLLEVFLKSIPEFSDTVPTFILSEVVLTYMAVNSCNSVIEWIGELFQNCLLSIYEQINPFDAFGQVMCGHFKKLGSPLKCILKYPTLENQINRHKEYGFTDCFAVKASDFYRLNTSNEERLRINRLELFDEYEPWHLKCSHYTLISATKGAFCTQIAQEAYSKFKHDAVDLYRQILNTPCVEKSDSNIIKINFFPIKFGIRFGHSMSAINSKIFVFGGFGENAADKNGKHLRLSAIEVVDLEKMTLDVIEPVNKTVADRMFHCSSTWSINNAENPAIFVSLGRSNPSKLFDSIVKLSLKNNNVESLKEDDILMEKIEPKMDPNDTNSNLCRFRHSTCVSNDSRLFIYGGKYFDDVTNETHALNDCYVLDSTLSYFKKINIDESICVPRHSHSLTTWKNYVIISGGIDSNENPLNDIILVDCSTYELKKLELNNGIVFPRYSHTSHVIGDTLVLIGGTNFSEIPPGVCFIDLNNLNSYEFNIPSQISDGNPLILTCHTSHVIDKNSILVVGGGAICFTFGTHLNRQPIILDLSDCWSKFQNF